MRKKVRSRRKTAVAWGEFAPCHSFFIAQIGREGKFHGINPKENVLKNENKEQGVFEDETI